MLYTRLLRLQGSLCPPRIKFFFTWKTVLITQKPTTDKPNVAWRKGAPCKKE